MWVFRCIFLTIFGMLTLLQRVISARLVNADQNLPMKARDLCACNCYPHSARRRNTTVCVGREEPYVFLVNRDPSNALLEKTASVRKHGKSRQYRHWYGLLWLAAVVQHRYNWKRYAFHKRVGRETKPKWKRVCIDCASWSIHWIVPHLTPAYHHQGSKRAALYRMFRDIRSWFITSAHPSSPSSLPPFLFHSHSPSCHPRRLTTTTLGPSLVAIYLGCHPRRLRRSTC